jgi:hypothetical protein
MSPPAIAGVPQTARVSVPPTDVSRGELRTDAGWTELGTGSHPSMIPKAPPPPRFGAAASSLHPGPLRSVRPGAASEPRRASQWPEARGSRPSSYPEAPEADRLYRHALLLREQGRMTETLSKLEELYRADPEHAEGRLLLHKLSGELGREDLAAQHTDWVLAHCEKRGAHGELCAVYRRTRMAFAGFAWSERALRNVLLAADRTADSRVVLDATKLLLTQFPNSGVLAHALFASARVQCVEGRPDLARSTLQTLLNRFPRDPLAMEARRKLLELGL